MSVVECAVYGDASHTSRLYTGAFPTRWLHESQADDSSSLRVDTAHLQVTPIVRQHALALLESNEHRREFQVARSEMPSLACEDTAVTDLFGVLQLHGNHESAGVVDGDISWFDAKLGRAASYRQRGNELFKQEKIGSAIRAYTKALEWLECPSDCTYDPLEQAQVDEIAIPCHTNLATCYWKRSQMDQCILNCSKVLARVPTHSKALFRRSQAYLQSKSFDEAVSDLERAVASDPASTLFQSHLDKAKRARAQHQSRAKQAFAKGFA
ncbi:hypothetical protein Poli38472_010075 [Pythium oligandrum]|uniref:peptidylprolyl isomerase n=1 Tax=Pythium oligandrum TaxID=41045 RepID=A0A8K1FDM2_PYTOL|nr:hypothetical protein Poli38472_010075 [Pythium oligandrum]|eukprot:TMW58516.1 hypothetical protein Poli38472_010075 [Pythium oligandrum]